MTTGTINVPKIETSTKLTYNKSSVYVKEFVIDTLVHILQPKPIFTTKMYDY